MSFRSRLLGAVALGLPIVAHAGPSDYVYEPAVEYGGAGIREIGRAHV